MEKLKLIKQKKNLNQIDPLSIKKTIGLSFDIIDYRIHV